MPKKYQHAIKKINNFNFENFDDSELLARINLLKEKLNNLSNDIIYELFSIIREVIDRRLGIWKIFDSDLSDPFKTEAIQANYDNVRAKRQSLDNSQIYLDNVFYAEVRRLRQAQLSFTPFDVQLIGGLALLDGKIAEMGTGEGKTIVAVFPASVWALSGKKVHIATVNDYLALRDCMWMSPVYRFLGLNVDCVLSYMPDDERRNSYQADIIYGNNYEFGFDYLRDNLKNRVKDKVQSKLEYVIIDEIDSILMDEATTPLIISGSPENNTSDFWRFKGVIESLIKQQKEITECLFDEFEAEGDPEIQIIKLIQIKMADPLNEKLQVYLADDETTEKIDAIHGKFIAGRSEYKLEEDLLYIVNEKQRTVKLTDNGITFVEEKLGEGFLTMPLNHNSNIKGEQVRNLLQLLRAYTLYRKDEDYIVSNGGIIIVDEFTGRLAFGKKYEEGLHQAIECKEGLQITPENRVMGKITHPNYFRIYEKMAGMTATAHTEADEFKRLYKLEIVKVPTNKPVIRIDLPDKFYKTEEEKFEEIINDIKECYSVGRPILIGTRSVEKSENLSAILEKNNIPHNVLNAKNHEEEAEIIKNAGQPYAVTIATNMAGRGTDIVLGQNVVSGLHVIGTERHTARRIDDQLIGRSGRQGDPGSSRFYLSLQDDLFRLFASDEMPEMAKAIENRQINKLKIVTKKAQRKSEETSYAIRKHLIEHDDVIDKQRKVIYKMREAILTDNEIEKRIQEIIADYVDSIVPSNFPFTNIENALNVYIPDNFDDFDRESVKNIIIGAIGKVFETRRDLLGKDFYEKLGKAIMLEVIDNAWTDYLSFQNEFDNSIMLRSYVKGDVIVDYKRECAKSFKDLLSSIKYETLRGILAYPLPKEKTDSALRTDQNKQLSDQIKKML